MEVILREHVDNLGRRGEVVKVAAGYARNYLLPRKLALLATAGNRQRIDRERSTFEAKEAERRKIQLQEPIKRIGEFDIPIRLDREVTATVKVKVVAEGEAEKQKGKT